MEATGSLTQDERSVLGWLADRQDEITALLELLVNVDSGSHNKAGVDKVGSLICEFLTAHNVQYQVIANERYGDAIRARIGGGDGSILLLGHRDTVFPDGEAGRRRFRIEAGRGYGPGVSDMKAGLVMNCFVAAAMSKCAPRAADLTILFTADEEIGSPSSRALIEQEAKRAAAVFNAEPGRPTGAVVTGRKAGIFLRCDVTGKAAHAGVNFDKGASAILDLAHKITALSALTDLPEGITLNVGVVSGGQTVNTVAPCAHAVIDLRYVSPGDREPLLDKIERIVRTPHVVGTCATVEVTAEFLPLLQTPESLQLFELYRRCAASLGVSITSEFTGGCSDAGFSASVGAPTLCGVGPIGAMAHSPEEYVELLSMVPRSQILALAILRHARERQ